MKITLNILKKGDWNRIAEKPYIYILTYKGKKYMVRREGICDYKSCNNVCCKFFHVKYSKDSLSRDYAEGFGEYTQGGIKVIKDCKHLCEDQTCSRWKKKLPEACKQFPNPNDPVYWEVLDECSFKYKVLYKLKDMKRKRENESKN